jgi:hypothetical protein
MLLPRRTVACLLWMLVLAPMLAAQGRPAQRNQEELVMHAYTLKHQRASDAYQLVYPLLTPRGSVELQNGGNTLVIRDTLAAQSRIAPVLQSFDHPARPLRLDIYVVKASRDVVSPTMRRSDLPEPITRNLRQVLNYDIYEVAAQAQLWAMEGQSVVYSLSDDFEVRFRFGTLLNGQRVKLSDFRIARKSEGRAKSLIHTNLNLWVEQTVNLGLAKSETSREALMVVMTLRDVEVQRLPRKVEP